MMTLTRSKISMMIAAVAAVMSFAATGCTDEEPKTPAEQLLQAAQDGNKRIDKILRNNEVLTAQIVAETLEPIDKASVKVNAELISWQEKTVDPQFQAREIEIYLKAGTEIANLTAKLDAQGFELGEGSADTCGSGGSGEDCECSDVTITPEPDAGSGTTTDPDTTTSPPGDGSATLAAPDDPEGVVQITQKAYWKRYLCRVACAGVQTACTLACGPIVVGGVTVPLAVVCVGLCSAAGALCQDACGQSYPNCR